MRRRRFFPPAHEETDKGHGRIEIRRIVVAAAERIPTLKFPGLQQIFRIERQVWRGKDSKPSREIAYGLTSLRKEQADPAQLLALNRGHWSVENKSHYVRDVTFAEDLSRNRSGAARNLRFTAEYGDFPNQAGRRCLGRWGTSNFGSGLGESSAGDRHRSVHGDGMTAHSTQA